MVDEHRHELLAAEAGEVTAIVRTFQEVAPEHLQHQVACLVTMRVVHGFEEIDVEEDKLSGTPRVRAIS